MQAKQTGPARMVKGRAVWERLAILAAVPCALTLAACATGWVNPSKTPAEMRADDEGCSRNAEEDALMRSGRTRADYGAPPSGPAPGGYGQTPMQMHDRDSTARDFSGAYERCMESKGYTRGSPKR